MRGRAFLWCVALACSAGACTSSTSPGGDASAPPTSPTSPSTTGRATSGATTPTTVADEVPAPTGGHGAAPSPRPGPVGSQARVLLRADGAMTILVDALVQDGAMPAGGALPRAVDLLRQVSGKPTSATTTALPGTGQDWTADALRSVADRYGARSTAEQAVVHLLFVRGRSADGDGVLGVSVRGDVAAVFADEVESAASPLAGPGPIARAVTLHELGHLLGLVDLVVDTGRADPAHPGHSTNPRSVMYWAVESSLVGDLLTGGPPQDLDDDDRADLRRLREG